jgi:hypothetical protein
MVPLLLAALAAAGEPTVAELNEAALQALSERRFDDALEALMDLHERVPDNGRISYNLGAALFGTETYAAAESLMMESDGVGADTLSSARAASRLATAIGNNDYAGVSSAADTLRRLLAEGSAVTPLDAANYETALNWLLNHEPPTRQGQGGQSGESSERQEQGEEDAEGEESPSEPRQDGPSREQTEDRQPSSLAGEDMTRELARRILDLVREAAPPDSSAKVRGAVGGGQPW